MNRRPLISAGLALGIGMGGFVDGILFHQIFQLHSKSTGRIPKDSLANYSINMVWDGLFHVATWVVTAVGIGLLFAAGRRHDVPWCGRTLVGAALAGWGLFNLVEGVINHHILHLHHVYEPAGESVWDYLFLCSGVLFLALGWWIISNVRSRSADASHVAE